MMLAAPRAVRLLMRFDIKSPQGTLHGRQRGPPAP